jgi:hypothetical protein
VFFANHIPPSGPTFIAPTAVKPMPQFVALGWPRHGRRGTPGSPGVHEAPQVAGEEVVEERVAFVGRAEIVWSALIAVARAAEHREPGSALRHGRDRRHEPGRLGPAARRVGLVALAPRPTEVDERQRSGRGIHVLGVLFDRVLADVADVEAARHHVDLHADRIAQAVGDQELADVGGRAERVVPRIQRRKGRCDRASACRQPAHVHAQRQPSDEVWFCAMQVPASSPMDW